MHWKQLNEKKWELSKSGKVIATIFRKREKRYSLFVASPMVYREVAPLLGKTWIYEDLEKAREGCEKHLKEDVLPWCKAVSELFE